MGDALDLAVDGLAVYRLTRLVTADGITAAPRGRFLRWATETVATPTEECGRGFCRHTVTDHDEHGCTGAHDGPCPCPEWVGVRLRMRHPKLAELIECPWCVGWYCSILAVCWSTLSPRTWRPVSRVFALSAMAGLLSGYDRTS